MKELEGPPSLIFGRARRLAGLAALAVWIAAGCGKPAPAKPPPPPSGVMWEALQRVPRDVNCHSCLLVFDYREVAGNPDRWRRTWAFSVARIIREELIRTLGLPEDSLRTVIYHNRVGMGDWQPEYYLQTTLLPAEMSAIFARLNATEEIRSGFPAWQLPGRVEGFAFVDGWLMCVFPGPPDDPIRVHLGKQDSLAANDGVDELVRRLPNVLPMEVDLTPREFDATRLASWIDPETGRSCTLAYYRDEASVRWAKSNLARTHGPAPEERFEWSGLFLSYSKAGPSDPVYFRRYAEVGIHDIHPHLLRLRFKQGRFPTTAEGLAATGLDAERIRDPWGRAYRYECPVGGAPGCYDLRSAGPDGRFETDDDVR